MKVVFDIGNATTATSAILRNELGPVQLLVIGFERTDMFSGEILAELAALEDRGTIRVLDLLYVEKVAANDLMVLEIEDLTEQEAVQFGGVISKFLGLNGGDLGDGGALDATVGGDVFGFDGRQVIQELLAIPEGTAAGILLVEHIWATHLRDVVRRAGGFPITQGFLSPEAILMVGEETRAIRDAAIAIEMAEIVEAAALLDAAEVVLATAVVREAAEEAAAEAIAAERAIRAEAAANAVRALVAAGIIEQYAAGEALDALVSAELIAADALVEATTSL